jgi:O-antigen ligase
MPIVAIIFGTAGLIWAALVARRSSLLVGCGALLVVAYALGHEFWNVRVGGLPITLDRLLLAGLLATAAFRWSRGEFAFRRMTGEDWFLIALLGVLGVSAIFSGQPEFTDGVTSKWGRLLASFILPAVLYALIRQLPIGHRDWSRMLVALVVLGVYLACTAVFEVCHCWSLVLPRYISDPSLGIHFGRARGPELNAVSLGIYLTACCLSTWILLPEARQRWQQLAILLIVPLTVVGVFLTYTRSTWIGLALSSLVVAAFQIPRRWRVPAFGGGAVVVLLLFASSWGNLIDIKREGSAGDAEHSVDQRESFAYVSWQMFCDHPILGVGFGRFYDQKLPYLSDRRQTVELESIRKLHHHNTLLSVLTETGMVGLAAFVALLVAFVRSGWLLATNPSVPSWVRAQGVLTLALIANYLSSAIFHDLTLLPSQELLLFVFAAVTVNLRQVSKSYGITIPGQALSNFASSQVRGIASV